jgi:hypothetical protein
MLVIAMVTCEKKLELSKVVERLRETGIYTMSGREVAYMFRDAAYKMGIDLKKANLEETRKFLSKGTPLSQIILEMRER